MDCYFDACFQKQAEPQSAEWRDVSTATYWVFESAFGNVRLRKRQNYPASFAKIEGSILAVGYGDYAHANRILSSSLSSVAEADFYTEEFMLVIADCDSQAVTVQRDALSTLPLVVGCSGDRLALASKYERCLERFSDQPLHAEPMGLLESLYGWRATYHSLFSEVQVAYDRCRLAWRDGRLRRTEAPNAQAVRLAYEQRDADPKLFVAFLEETLDRYWYRYSAGRPIACDLSGGYDSTSVCGYLADKARPVLTGTVRYPGLAGDTVEHKIRDLQQRFGVPNVLMPVSPDTDYPLVDMVETGKWQGVYPTGSLYNKPFQRLAAIYQRQGIDVVFTGVGGDELCQHMLTYDYLPQGADELSMRRDAPRPLFAGSQFDTFKQYALISMDSWHPKTVPLVAYQVMQNIAAYDSYFDQGIWPVHPLADPRLYAYCQSLPIEYRSHKNILLSYLKARQFPHSAHNNPAKETFSGFFDAAVINLRPVMQQFFSSSMLADWGVIDQGIVMGWLDTLANRDERWLQLYMLLIVEINLQTIT